MNQNQWDGQSQDNGQNPYQGQGHHQQGGDWQHQQQPRQQRGRKKRDRSALGPGQTAAAQAIPEERMQFIRKTYSYVTGAIFLCVAMMALFWNSPAFEPVMVFMLSTSWLLVLALFIGFSWLGDWMAHSVESKGLQHIGLLVGVGAYAVIFSFLLVTTGALDSTWGVDPSVLQHAVVLTLVTFAALTAVVFITKQDFSILRTGLVVASVLAIGAIVAGALFGFTLGLGFAVMMVGFCGAMIIYQTSNILHHYPTDRHVGASLALFSSIGMLFWYLFMILGMDS